MIVIVLFLTFCGPEAPSSPCYLERIKDFVAVDASAEQGAWASCWDDGRAMVEAKTMSERGDITNGSLCRREDQ